MSESNLQQSVQEEVTSDRLNSYIICAVNVNMYLTYYKDTVSVVDLKKLGHVDWKQNKALINFVNIKWDTELHSAAVLGVPYLE